MLEGTELNFAYSPLSSSSAFNEEPAFVPQEPQEKAPPAKSHKSQSLQQVMQQAAAASSQPPVTQPVMTQQTQMMYDPGMFSSGFNRQYDQEQRMMALINEYKKRQAVSKASEETYWDKLGSKKKEVYKFLQSALIIMFAISVHFLISHYFNKYLEANDLSFERELALRILYPVAILFIAWNIITFNR